MAKGKGREERDAERDAERNELEPAAEPKKVWTPELKAEVVEGVLERMAEGKTVQESVERVWRGWAYTEQLRCPAKLTPGMVRVWIAENEGWWGRYQRMKTMMGQAMAEEAIRVARESTSQTTATDRVLIETLKWAASKANPAEYGEKQTVEHQGSQQLQVKIVEEGAPSPLQSLRAVEAALEQTMLGEGEVLAILPGRKH